MSSNSVRDNPSEHRYELVIDGETAFAAYRIEGDTIIFTHTIVPKSLEGHGVGSTLVKGALDDVRSRNLRVVAQCAFVAAYIARHPDYGDLID